MNNPLAALSLLSVFCSIPGMASTVDVTLRFGDNLVDKETIITIENLRSIKKKILDGGKRETFCNMYNDNPTGESKSYRFYLIPDTGQANGNCDPKKSDFNHLTVRQKSMGRNEYLAIDFPNGNSITVAVHWPSDDLTVKDIRSFAEEAIKEFLEIK